MKWKKFLAGVLAAAMMTAAGTATVSAFLDSWDVPSTYGNMILAKGKDSKNERLKSIVYQFVGKTLGSKLQVAVLPYGTTIYEEDPSVYEFSSLFQNGKIDSSVTKRAKDIASARIDNTGKVTVTAKKQTGLVEVWVYEVIDKKLVWSQDGGMGKRYDIDPSCEIVGVGASTSSITYTTDPTKLSWNTPTAGEVKAWYEYRNLIGGEIPIFGPILAKSDKGIELSVSGDPINIYLAEKKLGATLNASCNLAYQIENSYDSSVIEIAEYYDGWDFAMQGRGYSVSGNDMTVGVLNGISFERTGNMTVGFTPLDYYWDNDFEEVPVDLYGHEIGYIEYAPFIRIIPKSPGKTALVVKSPASGKKTKITVTVK